MDFKVQKQGRYYLSTRFDDREHKNKRVYINVSSAQVSLAHSQCYIKAIDNQTVNIQGTENPKMQNDQTITYRCDIRNPNGESLDDNSFEVIRKDNTMKCQIKRLENFDKSFPIVQLNYQRIGPSFFECDYKFSNIGTFELTGYLEKASGREDILAKSTLHNRATVLAYPKDFTNARFYDFKLRQFHSNVEMFDVSKYNNIAGYQFPRETHLY